MNVVPILYIYTRRFCLSLLFLKSRYIDIAKKGFIYAKPHACISYKNLKSRDECISIMHASMPSLAKIYCNIISLPYSRVHVSLLMLSTVNYTVCGSLLMSSNGKE